MSCILHIETSTDLCSVAVSEDSQVIYEQENHDGHNHAVQLAPFVEEAIRFAENHAIPIDAVAVSSGPGSYTGLRIGVSTAKGVAYGKDIPLIEVPTLKLLCVPVLLYHEEIEEDALICPMVDARRMEVYSALYDRALRPQRGDKETPAAYRGVQPEIITEDSYREVLDQRPVYFFGNGAEKCKAVIRHPNAHFIDGVRPLAKHMAPLAEMAHARRQFADTAYFEPFYLKEFQATVAKSLL